MRILIFIERRILLIFLFHDILWQIFKNVVWEYLSVKRKEKKREDDVEPKMIKLHRN